jgi:hypothetical protein
MRRVQRAILLLLLVGSVLACYNGEDRPDLSFTPTELPEARAGEFYGVTITVTGGETPVGQFWVEAGELPVGLTIQHDTGASTAELSGTPEEAGSYAFTIGASCLGTSVSGQRGSVQYELLVR